MDAKTDAEIRANMTDEQILLERKLTCEAIDGAIALGYQNTNKPPSDDHWLAPFWRLGRKQAELEASAALPSDAAQAPIGEVVNFRETAFASIPVIAWEVKPDLGAKLYAAPVAPAPSEHEKMMLDAVIHGQGFMKDGQHIPLDQVREQPDERAAFEEWAKDQGFPIGQSDVGDGLSYFDMRTQGAFDAWQASATASQAKFECAARKQGSVGGNDPADCDWPICGCDEHANKVIGALEESGALKGTPIYQIGANAGGGIAWWDVDKDRYEREKKAGYMKTGIVYREES